MNTKHITKNSDVSARAEDNCPPKL